MPRVPPKARLPFQQRQLLLQQLKSYGQSQMKIDWQHILHPLLPSGLQDKELLVRYLLLIAVLDQQAESASARDVVKNLYSVYGSAFFLSPQNHLSQMGKLIQFTKHFYRPKVRVLRMTTEGITLLRIGGYLLTLFNISQTFGSLLNFLSQAFSPVQLLNLILADDLLGGLLYDKAARLYTGWVSHPALVDISRGNWHVSDIPMVVNGHVCKVFSRSGFLETILIEDTQRMIVKAREMRMQLENEVKQLCPGGDYFMIDYGAFHIGINFCFESLPNCTICPIQNICLKDTRFRAY